MSGKPQPPIQLRHLAKELVRLRQRAGLSQRQVTERTRLDKSTLSRFENAGGRPHLSNLTRLLDLYGVSDAERAALEKLHKSANQEGWLSRYPDSLPGEYSAYIGFESEATTICNWQGQVVPGLLQTADYARGIIKAGEPELSEAERERRVEIRMARQKVLRNDSPLQLNAIIDESVLRREIGGHDVMRTQLEKLAQDTKQPNITLQVIPFSTGAHAGSPGPFAILDFEEYSSVVYLEHMGGDVFLDNEDDVTRFKKTVNYLRDAALNPQQTKEFIRALREATQ